MGKMIGLLFLTILKIAGCILLVLLLLIGLLCFVAVKYRVKIVLEEKTVKARLSWIGFVLSVPILYTPERSVEIKCKVLGIKIWPFAKKKKKSKKKNTSSKRSKQKKRSSVKRQDAVEQNEQKQDPTPEEHTTVPMEESRQEEENLRVDENAPKPEPEEVTFEKEEADNKAEPPQQSKVSWWNKIRQKILFYKERIQSGIKACKKGYRRIRQKVHSLRDLWELLQTEKAKSFVCIVRKNVVLLWKKIRPRTIKGKIVFGMEDPCTTGQILGGLSILYPFTDGKLQIVPDFQQKRLEGTVIIKGKVRLFTLLKFILTLWLNEDGQALQKEWKKWKEDF
ncbi:MAG: DUF2953 domain-containing protein [Lachnospiraceae bacterium]|nr:DUF2953 domain-containing protein [Lachnospiraceae bacterium]